MSKKPKEEIRLNTDDNQAEAQTVQQAKKVEEKANPKKEAAPLLKGEGEQHTAFALEDGNLDDMFLVPPSDEENPISELAFDQSDILLPEPPLPDVLIPDFPISDVLLPDTQVIPEEIPPGEIVEQPKPEESGNTEAPVIVDPEANFTVIPLLIPESAYNRASDYFKMKDFYNVVYYGRDMGADEEHRDEVTKWVAEAVTGLKTETKDERSFLTGGQANLQLINSLQLNDPKIQALQEENRQSLFKTYVQDEVRSFAGKSGGNEEDIKQAKRIVYYVGKYNEKTNNPINPSEYGEAIRRVVEAADTEVKDSGKLVEALNKYQVIGKYAPDAAQHAKDKQSEIAKKIFDSPVKSKEEKKENLSASQPRVASIVDDITKPLLEETKEKVSELSTPAGPEPGSQPDSKTFDSPVLQQAAEVASTDINRAVILASDAVENGNSTEEAKALLNDLSRRLLAEAEQFNYDEQEQAYEMLSTNPVISGEISDAAGKRKDAFSYARKAEELAASKKYAEALYYASESNQLYNKGQNDGVMRQIAEQLLKETEKAELKEQLAVYRMLASVNGLPQEYADEAKSRQEAIDNYRRGMEHPNLEKSVYYLGLASQNSAMQTLVQPALQEKSGLLFESAKSEKERFPVSAARYYKTLVETPGVDEEIKQQSRQVLHEMSYK